MSLLDTALASFGMLKQLAELTSEERERIHRAVPNLNSAGFDPWGVSPATIEKMVRVLKPLYRNYFRVETSGLEHVPAGRVLLIANHGGQLPLDGMMVGLSLLLDAEPPRLARGMVERWAPSLPFVSAFFARSGQVVGDHRNCRELLEADQCVLVFPEGVGGSGKTIDQKYELQPFGTGFMRLALETRTPIVPVAVIGSEETYPAIHNAKRLAKLVGAPYLPITPLFPLLGPLGAVPLPCKITLRFAAPLRFPQDPDCPDSELSSLIFQVRESLETELRTGLERRGEKIFTGSGK